MELCRHEQGQESSGSALAYFRVKIQRIESVEEVVSQEGDQQKALNGVGIVLVNVVGMPAVHQFVESVILDIPSLVPEGDGPTGGDEADG